MKPCHVLNFLAFETSYPYMACSYEKHVFIYSPMITTNGHVTNNATITICNELWDTFMGATNNYTASGEVLREKENGHCKGLSLTLHDIFDAVR